MAALAPRLEPAQVNLLETPLAILEKSNHGTARFGARSTRRAGAASGTHTSHTCRIPPDCDPGKADGQQCSFSGGVTGIDRAGAAAGTGTSDAYRRRPDCDPGEIEGRQYSFVVRRWTHWSHSRRGWNRRRPSVRGMPCLGSWRNRRTTRRPSRCGAQGLAALAPRLEPAQAKRAWDALIAKWRIVLDFAIGPKALAALRLRVEPARVARTADVLIANLEKSADNQGSFLGRARGLTALASQMEPAQAKRACDGPDCDPGEVGGRSSPLFAAGDALAALAPRMEPAQAKRAWDALTCDPGERAAGSVVGQMPRRHTKHSSPWRRDWSPCRATSCDESNDVASRLLCLDWPSL